MKLRLIKWTIEKAIKSAIKKKYPGCSVIVKLNDFEVVTHKSLVNISLHADCNVNKKDIPQIIKMSLKKDK